MEILSTLPRALPSWKGSQATASRRAPRNELKFPEGCVHNPDRILQYFGMYRRAANVMALVRWISHRSIGIQRLSHFVCGAVLPALPCGRQRSVSHRYSALPRSALSKLIL
jgi:hypothetical protein